MCGTLTALGFGQVTTSGYPGRVGGPAASLLALAPGRHLVDVARLRPVDHAAAAGARLRDRGALRGVARPVSFLRVDDAARGRARARSPACARKLIHLLEPWSRPDGGGKQAAIPGYTRRRQDRHGVEGDRRRLRHRPLHRGVRRRRARQQSAPRGRGRDRRAGRRQVLRRRRGGAGVLRRRGRRAAPARRAARRAGAATTRRAASRARWPRDERRRRADRTASPDCCDGIAAAAARRRGHRSHAGQPRGAPGRRVPRGARQRTSTASSTRRRRSPTARARCCGSRRRWRWCPTCPRRSWSRRCRACANTRARIADRFFGAPSRDLAVAGITGTNGKTTCAYLLAQALERRRPPAALHGHARHRPARAQLDRERAHHRRCGHGAAHARAAARASARQAWRWKCPRTRSTRRASAPCASTPPCSPTSRAITSTITARWTATAPPRRGCSRAPGSRRASSTSTMPSAAQLAARSRAAAAASIVTSRGHQSQRAHARGFRARHARASCRRSGIELEFDSSWGTGALRVSAGRRLQRRQPARRCSRCCSTGTCRSSRCIAALARVQRRAPGRMETVRRRGTRRSRSSTTRTRPTRCARRCALRARTAAAGSRGVRLRRRPRPGQAPDHGRDRRGARRRHRHHRRQPAQRGSPHAIVADIAAGIAGRQAVPHRARSRARDPRGARRDASAGDVVLIAGKGHEDYQIYGARAPRVSAIRRSSRAALAARARRCGMNRTLLGFARACGGALRGADRAYTGVSTDTRTLKRGELFVALRGPRFNGQRFRRGRRGSRRGGRRGRARTVDAPLPQIVVADTQARSSTSARRWRAQFRDAARSASPAATARPPSRK